MYTLISKYQIAGPKNKNPGYFSNSVYNITKFDPYITSILDAVMQNWKKNRGGNLLLGGGLHSLRAFSNSFDKSPLAGSNSIELENKQPSTKTSAFFFFLVCNREIVETHFYVLLSPEQKVKDVPYIYIIIL